MLCTILGGLGSGKTLLMTILAYYTQRPIVSNYELKFENKEVESFNLNKFIKAEYENCMILIDEAYAFLESRVSNTELNRIMSYILFQSRKKNVELYITAQLFSSIDKRFRELSDIIIVASRENSDFKYTLLCNNTITTFSYLYEKVVPFFVLYNTNQVISTTNPKILFDSQDSDEKLTQIENYAKEIEEYYKEKGIKKISLNSVNLYCNTHKIPKFFCNDIHTVIRMRENEQKLDKKHKKDEKK